jgi:hypothetical protein
MRTGLDFRLSVVVADVCLSVLELLDQKNRGFLILIALNGCFLNTPTGSISRWDDTRGWRRPEGHRRLTGQHG